MKFNENFKNENNAKLKSQNIPPRNLNKNDDLIFENAKFIDFQEPLDDPAKHLYLESNTNFFKNPTRPEENMDLIEFNDDIFKKQDQLHSKIDKNLISYNVGDQQIKSKYFQNYNLPLQLKQNNMQYYHDNIKKKDEKKSPEMNMKEQKREEINLPLSIRNNPQQHKNENQNKSNVHKFQKEIRLQNNYMYELESKEITNQVKVENRQEVPQNKKELEFLNTLLRLKSTRDSVETRNTNVLTNINNQNDESKSYIKELLDICQENVKNENEIFFNENISLIQHNKSSSNILNNTSNNNISNNIGDKSISYTPIKRDSIKVQSKPVENKLNKNDLIEITNNRKKAFSNEVSSVEGYFRRRHNETQSKLEKLKKEKLEKENSMMKGPEMNKKSKEITEKLMGRKNKNTKIQTQIVDKNSNYLKNVQYFNLNQNLKEVQNNEKRNYSKPKPTTSNNINIYIGRNHINEELKDKTEDVLKQGDIIKDKRRNRSTENIPNKLQMKKSDVNLNIDNYENYVMLSELVNIGSKSKIPEEYKSNNIKNYDSLAKNFVFSIDSNKFHQDIHETNKIVNQGEPRIPNILKDSNASEMKKTGIGILYPVIETNNDFQIEEMADKHNYNYNNYDNDNTNLGISYDSNNKFNKNNTINKDQYKSIDYVQNQMNIQDKPKEIQKKFSYFSNEIQVDFSQNNNQFNKPSENLNQNVFSAEINLFDDDNDFIENNNFTETKIQENNILIQDDYQTKNNEIDLSAKNESPKNERTINESGTYQHKTVNKKTNELIIPNYLNNIIGSNTLEISKETIKSGNESSLNTPIERTRFGNLKSENKNLKTKINDKKNFSDKKKSSSINKSMSTSVPKIQVNQKPYLNDLIVNTIQHMEKNPVEVKSVNGNNIKILNVQENKLNNSAKNDSLDKSDSSKIKSDSHNQKYKFSSFQVDINTNSKSNSNSKSISKKKYNDVVTQSLHLNQKNNQKKDEINKMLNGMIKSQEENENYLKIDFKGLYLDESIKDI